MRGLLRSVTARYATAYKPVGDFHGAGAGLGEMDVALGVNDYAAAVRQIASTIFRVGSEQPN